MQSAVVDERFFSLSADFFSGFSGPREEVRDIETNQTLALIGTATPQDAAQYLSTIKAAQQLWLSAGAYGRARVISRFSAKVWQFQDEIIAISQILAGKSYMDALEEFFNIVSTATTVKSISPRLESMRRGKGLPPFSTYRVRTRPLGVIGFYTAPESPQSLVSDVLQALIAGNGVISFVDPQAAIGSVLMRNLLVDAGMPFGLWKIIPIRRLKDSFSTIPGLDTVVANLQTKAGQRVSKQCRKYGVPFRGYLSSLNVGVVAADARLDHAVRATVRAAFNNAGQALTACRIVFVNDLVWDDFCEQVVEFAQSQARTGALSQNTTTVGSMLKKRSAKRIEEKVSAEVARGATILLGGKRRRDLGPAFFEPTILTGVDPDSDLIKGSDPGPVMCLVPYTHIEEAVSYVTTAGNTYLAYIFTRSEDQMADFIEAVDIPAVVMNDGYLGLISTWKAPAQGSKGSGNAIRHGLESFQQFTRVQSTARQSVISWVSDDLCSAGSRIDLVSLRWKMALWRARYITASPVRYFLEEVRGWLTAWRREPF